MNSVFRKTTYLSTTTELNLPIHSPSHRKPAVVLFPKALSALLWLQDLDEVADADA